MVSIFVNGSGEGSGLRVGVGIGVGVGVGEMWGGFSIEVFGVLLGGIFWYMILIWSLYSFGFEVNLNDDDNLLKLIKIWW